MGTNNEAGPYRTASEVAEPERVTVVNPSDDDRYEGVVIDSHVDEETSRLWLRVALDDSSFSVPAMDLRKDRRPLSWIETIPLFVVYR